VVAGDERVVGVGVASGLEGAWLEGTGIDGAAERACVGAVGVVVVCREPAKFTKCFIAGSRV
jgi:hypothetical protein